MGEEVKIPVETGSTEQAPDAPKESHDDGDKKPAGSKKKWMIIGGVVVLVLVLGGVAFAVFGGKGKEAKNDTAAKSVQSVEQAGGDPQSTDPVAKGKYLSLSNCTGTGSKKLSTAPMKVSDIGLIEPYGLVAGGHVTPVDHQYYWGVNQKAAPSTYDVLAPSDGTIVSVEARPKGADVADFRVVISYSCTFFSYFDLANSLSPEVAAKMPSGYATINGPQSVKIPVKEGEVLAKVGGQSLDYAVWDTTKIMTGLLVAKAYNNSEPWKINTVEPTDYYTDALKAQVLPLYGRAVAPRDGTIGYDVDGMAVGNWFKKGTNGYIGAFTESDYSSQTYADGHLSLAPDFLDPTGWIFSTGAVNHGTQYAIKAPTKSPDKVDMDAGLVKFELVGVNHTDGGVKWLGTTVPKAIKLDTSGPTKGTVLVQLTAKRELKVEVFEGKTPAQVSAFDASAVIYTRGDEATTMSR